jgi:uncharacterized DUF497 family protein
MRYEWDPVKDVLNQRKHGLRLDEGIPALEDPVANSWIDDRFDYGEERTVTIGQGSHKILYVISTERDVDLIRIVSVRRAEYAEIEQFYYRRT